MVPRKKSPDAKDVTMSARFSEAEAELIDAARGTTERSVWLREAALVVLRRKQDSGIPDQERDPYAHRYPRPVRPTQGPVSDSPGNPVPVTELRSARKPVAKGPCEHRVKPGSYCTRCGRLIQ